ncbi:MAG: hypothetical protein R3326_03460 [Gemmatimonadota bacterium]|nr:hypothetical protein [Gemmatimonadota bacterium]
MNHLHRILIATVAVALLGGASSAAAQDRTSLKIKGNVMLSQANNGDLEASYEGEESAEFVVVTAVVDGQGNVIERTEGETVLLKPGRHMIDLPNTPFVPGGGVAFDDLRPIGAEPRAYTPGRSGLPDGRYFLLYEDELDAPKVDGVRAPRRGVVAAGPSGTGKTMDKSSPKPADKKDQEAGDDDTTQPDVGDQGVMPGDNVNVVRKRPGRTKVTDSDHMQPGARGITPDDGGKDAFYVATLVPADERAPRVNVQPLILHGAAPDDKPDW